MRSRKGRRAGPPYIKLQPKSWRLYEAINAAAAAEYMTRASWLLKLAARHLGVARDSDEENAA